MEPKHESRDDAANGGRLKYLAEPACKHCGSLLKYTSTGKCEACAKRRAMARHNEIKELLRAARELQAAKKGN